MKFSIIATAIVAIQPALASTDTPRDATWNLDCDRVLWDGKGNELDFYRNKFREICTYAAGCANSRLDNTELWPTDQVMFGVCTGCPRPREMAWLDPRVPHCMLTVVQS